MYDDGPFVLSNALVTSPDGLWRMWSQGLSPEHYWPLTYTVFWIGHHLWGANPLGYHLVNVALHLANTLLVWRILRGLHVPGAWGAAALFGLHPVHVESVTWVIELKDVLSGMLYLSAFAAYQRFADDGRWRTFAVALACYVAALFSKSIALTLPAAIVIALWATRRPFRRRDGFALAAMSVIGAGIAFADVVAFQHANSLASGLSLVERCLVASRAIWFYLAKLAWPVGLAPFYPRWNIDVHSARQWLAVGGLLVSATVLGALAWRGRRWPLAAAAFFVVTLGPVLGFVDFAWMGIASVADRFQYLASIGPIALVAGSLHLWLTQRPAESVWLKPVAADVFVALGVLTWRQSALYEDEVTYYEAALKRNPVSSMAHTNLGLALASRRRVSEAIDHYREAIRVDPTFIDPRVNYANALIRLGRGEEAAAELRKAIQLSPDDPGLHDTLGIALAGIGRFDEAIAAYSRALQLDPNFADSLNNLGAALLDSGRPAQAIRYFEKYIRARPDDPLGHANLADAYRATGRQARRPSDLAG